MVTDNAGAASSASLTLQLLAITSALFCPVWVILTFSLLIYKATILPYPPTALGFELSCTFILWIVEVGAIKQVKKGNLTENAATLVIGLVLKALTCVGAIYYMWLQTYVMRLDVGFSATLLALDGLAIVFGAVTIQSISANASQQLNAAMAAGTKAKSE